MINFKLRLLPSRLIVLSVLAYSVTSVNAAEWKTEPSLSIRALYNDNLRMRPESSKEGSAGYSLVPQVKFAGIEQSIWDVLFNVKGKVDRYTGIEDGDNESLFFTFNGGRQTELTDWRLNTSYTRNTNFDTDFGDQNPDAGLDDRTERTTALISPSVKWSMSETSQLSLSLSNVDVAYDEVTSFNFQDFTTNSASIIASWSATEAHTIGFTSSYTEYDSPGTNFSYDQIVLQLDYTYTINPLSNISFSLGGRRLNSVLGNAITACNVFIGGSFSDSFLPVNGGCPDSITDGVVTVPVEPEFGEVEDSNDGTVADLTYSRFTETTSHSLTASRNVIPSGLGGAQERRQLTYIFNVSNTERFSTNLILNASETETLTGVSAINDRTRYRIEPSVKYRLNKNWSLQFLYRYIGQEFVDNTRDSASNAVYINLFLHWPRLTTTY